MKKNKTKGKKRDMERRCPACGCFLGIEQPVNGEVETGWQCNNTNCKSNNCY